MMYPRLDRVIRGDRINDIAGEPSLSSFLPQPGRWRRAVVCGMIQPSFQKHLCHPLAVSEVSDVSECSAWLCYP